MTWHVGFVRAVMHGRDGITGELLREAARTAGATDVSTYHSTGNVLFRADDGAAVCAAIADAATSAGGRDTPVLHRRADELHALVAAAPFAEVPVDDTERLVVFASVAVDADALRDVLPAPLRLVGVLGDRDVLAVRPHGDAPHPHPLVERLTGAPATARSITTVEGLVARLGDAPAA